MAKTTLTFQLSNAHARHRLYRAIHLLWRLCRSQAIAADVLSVARPTFVHACEGRPTEITLDQCKRAARMYALDVKDDFDPAEFAAVQAIVLAIDPQADIAYTSGSSVDHFPAKMRDFLWERWDKPLSYAVTTFAERGFKPKYLRQVIKRLILKEPVLALRSVEKHKGPDDVVNRWQRLVSERELVEARHGPRKEGEPKRRPVEVLPQTLGPKELQAIKALKKVNEERRTAEAKAPRKVSAAKGKLMVKGKQVGVVKNLEIEPTVFDRIAARREASEAPSAEAQARLAKLLRLDE